MKTAFLLFTILVLFFTIKADAAAPYGIKGQNQSSTIYSNVHQFPNNQVTNLGGINALVETGNKNILVNPSFEHSTFSTGWTNSAGTFTAETALEIDGLKAAKLVLSTQTMSLTQSSTLYASQFADGVQGLAMVWVKSSVAVNVCSIQAGVVSTVCVTTSTDNKWGLYKVPFIMGATSQGISIASTGSVTGTVYIDDAFVGVVSTSQEVSSSRIAGEAFFAGTTNCIWQRAVNTIAAFGTDADCPGPTIAYSSMGTWATTDSDLPRISISNLPAGTYKAKFIVQAANSAGATPALAINDGTTTCEPIRIYTGIDSVSQLVECTFVYTTGGSRVFELYGATNTGTFSLLNNVPSPRASAKFILEYFNPSQIYSAQCGANCVDSLSAKISVTGAKSSENISFLSGDCVVSGTGIYTCPVTSGVFSVLPNCTAIRNIGAGNAGFAPNFDIANSTTTSLRFVLTNQAGAEIAGAFNFICQKQGVDFVANRNIVGSFAEVVTSQGTTSPDIQSVYFGSGATCASVCTTGTCTICNQVGNKITSVTWAGATGEYNINGIDGTKYNCIGSGYGAGVYHMALTNRPASTSSLARIQFGTSGTNANSAYNVVNCTGVK